MKNILFLFAAVLSLTSTAAVRAEEGTYGSVFGGINWLENYSRNHNWQSHHHATSRTHHKFKFKTGYLVGGAVGFKWCNNVRAEAEVAYRHNKLDKAHWSCKNYSGDLSRHNHGNASVRTWSIMANGFYDFEVDCFDIKPYLGFGIGYANNKVTNGRWNSSWNNHHGRWNNRCKSQSNFAWQFIAGLAYPICENIDLDIQYRYFQSHKNVRSNDLVFGGKFMF